MKEFNYTITDPVGIHARPAGTLAKLCKEFKSEIIITKGEKSAAATKLMMLMSLGVKQNDEINVKISGEDEDAAYDKVKEFFTSTL